MVKKTEHDSTESNDNVEDNIEEVLERDQKILKDINRVSDVEFFELIKSMLATCNECRTNFIKRKKILYCPNCHSKDVS